MDLLWLFRFPFQIGIDRQEIPRFAVLYELFCATNKNLRKCCRILWYIYECRKEHYPGTPVVSNLLAILTSFDHISYCHLHAPITPDIMLPECIPILMSIFKLFRCARTSRISRIILSPRSTQLLACWGFFSGTPETQ